MMTLERLNKGEFDWHEKMNANMSIVENQVNVMEEQVSKLGSSGGGVVENLLATPYAAMRDQSSGSINASITDMRDGSLNITAMFMQAGTVSASSNAIRLKAGTYTFGYTKKVEEGYQEFTDVGAILTFFDDAGLTTNYTGEFEGLKIAESENLQTSVGSVYLNNVGPSDTFAIEKDAYIQCHFNIFQMVTNVMCDVSIYPMLESGSEAHDFIPYHLSRQGLKDSIDSIKEDYSETAINVGRKADTTKGNYSSALGYNNEASGNYSHAEGDSTKATGVGSHAEGKSTKASGAYSHAEGSFTEASEYWSHAEGCSTTASGTYSHAEGSHTEANGVCSHAEGEGTIAQDHQHVIGYYNDTKSAPNGDGSAQSTGTLFCIGSGSEDSPANAFRVTGAGATIAKKAYSTSGADYAEFFEWLDGNPDNEDRRGYFVTLDGLKIKKANAGDYILGVVSALPSVIGNYDEEWKGRYILDDFGAFITETFECTTTVFDKETGEEKEVTKQRTKWKENPDYDKTKDYTPREERQEWDAIGLLGVIVVQDDGTCEVNSYCKCSDGGIATSAKVSESSYLTPIYKVIDRVNDNLVKILFR